MGSDLGAGERGSAGRNGEVLNVSLARVHSSSVLLFLRGSRNPFPDTGFRAVRLECCQGVFECQGEALFLVVQLRFPELKSRGVFIEGVFLPVFFLRYRRNFAATPVHASH